MNLLSSFSAYEHNHFRITRSPARIYVQFTITGKFRFWKNAYSETELFNLTIAHTVVVWSSLLLMQIAMRCNVAVLNLSAQMSRGDAREPLAQLLLTSCLPLSSDMLFSNVTSRWDGAAEPHHLVWVHKNHTHLFVNTIVSHAARSRKKSSSSSSQASSNRLY